MVRDNEEQIMRNMFPYSTTDEEEKGAQELYLSERKPREPSWVNLPAPRRREYLRRYRESLGVQPQYVCPSCQSEAFVCYADHTDGLGPRLHCKTFSSHSFALEHAQRAKELKHD